MGRDKCCKKEQAAALQFYLATVANLQNPPIGVGYKPSAARVKQVATAAPVPVKQVPTAAPVKQVPTSAAPDPAKLGKPLSSNDSTRYLGLLNPVQGGFDPNSVQKANAHQAVPVSLSISGSDSTIPPDQIIPVIVSSLTGLADDVNDIHRRVLKLEDEVEGVSSDDDSSDDDSNDDEVEAKAISTASKSLYPKVPSIFKRRKTTTTDSEAAVSVSK